MNKADTERIFPGYYVLVLTYVAMVITYIRWDYAVLTKDIDEILKHVATRSGDQSDKPQFNQIIQTTSFRKLCVLRDGQVGPGYWFLNADVHTE